ncbi:hypothetical protein [Gorillibacterium sp. CAU 1737]|uniref:hypothetical protein n=1 Tax=Gorillibacterium sp. CAU 1737 TaxID=3140362 RepID=UPI0032605007
MTSGLTHSVGPFFCDGVRFYYSKPGEVIRLEQFYSSFSLYTLLLFGLIVYSVIAAYLFSREHTEATLRCPMSR